MTHKSRMAHLRVANTERLRKPHARNWAGAARNEALGITPPSTSFLPEFFSGHFTTLGDKGTGQRGMREKRETGNPGHRRAGKQSCPWAAGDRRTCDHCRAAEVAETQQGAEGKLEALAPWDASPGGRWIAQGSTRATRSLFGGVMRVTYRRYGKRVVTTIDGSTASVLESWGLENLLGEGEYPSISVQSEPAR